MPAHHQWPRAPRLSVLVGVVALLVAFCALLAIVVPMVGEGRVHPAQPRSAGRLRGIGQALNLYAQNTMSRLPSAEDDWVGLLTRLGFVPAEMFVSPDARDKSVISYFYVPGDPKAPPTGRVLVYEMPGLRAEGVYILYDDMHVALVPSAEAEPIIASLTLPDGTPWQPHLNPRRAP